MPRHRIGQNLVFEPGISFGGDRQSRWEEEGGEVHVSQPVLSIVPCRADHSGLRMSWISANCMDIDPSE